MRRLQKHKSLNEAFLSLSDLTNMLDDSQWGATKSLSEKLKDSLVEARRTVRRLKETIESIRIILDLERGRAGLEQSQRSIEMSRLSIEESKRVKLLTILAFIFVPLSLSTSVFGMNIQQIDQSGPSWWVVIITAAVITAVALIGWVIVRRLANTYDIWDEFWQEAADTDNVYYRGRKVAMLLDFLRIFFTRAPEKRIGYDPDWKARSLLFRWGLLTL